METQSVLKELRKLLYRGAAGTQSEIGKQLAKQGVDVTQSTISRCLKQLRAVRVREPSGRLVYRLPQDAPSTLISGSVGELVDSVDSNDSLIVVHTKPGSAALVAYQLDRTRPGGIIGTIAGDDTIFVAPPSGPALGKVVRDVRRALGK
jgi:transcriptional regulator of arginine metabolism